MKKSEIKCTSIRELPYHYDIVTPYIRYKYMTDVLYNRMIEIGFWWWRIEIYYKGGRPGYYFGQLLHSFRILVLILYYVVIDTTARWFKKTFKRNKDKQNELQ